MVGDTLAGRAAVMDTIPANALVADASKGTSVAFTVMLPEPSTLRCPAEGTITVPAVVVVDKDWLTTPLAKARPLPAVTSTTPKTAPVARGTEILPEPSTASRPAVGTITEPRVVVVAAICAAAKSPSSATVPVSSGNVIVRFAVLVELSTQPSPSCSCESAAVSLILVNLLASPPRNLESSKAIVISSPFIKY